MAKEISAVEKLEEKNKHEKFNLKLNKKKQKRKEKTGTVIKEIFFLFFFFVYKTKCTVLFQVKVEKKNNKKAK